MAGDASFAGMSATERNGGWAAVLFDLDGTLADTVALILACYRHTMRRHLGTERADAEWLQGLGTPLRDQLRGFARSDEEARPMLETYVSHQREIHDAMACAFPGLTALLESAAAHGTKLGLVTSKSREMGERTLGCCGFGVSFDALVFADDVRRGKPHPEPVRRALERLGAPEPASVLFVGDSPHDVVAGRDAGVRTAAVLWGPFSAEVLAASGPDWILADTPELAALIAAGPAGPARGDVGSES
ncbi:MAG: HAD family hydrolase [Longimicrobiales bacterium]